MSKSPSTKNPRYTRSAISALTTNVLNLKNPWVVAWWSATFPGFGHIALGRYLEGYFLVALEIFVNTMANLNTAIAYTFTGRFDLAKEALDSRWLLLYTAIFVFALWESYRFSVDLNKFYVLAERKNSPIDIFKMSSVAINFLDKRNPWLAVAWSAFIPGLGYLYIHRLASGFFILISWVVIACFSHLFEAIYYTMLGAFSQATAAVDPQWLLFMPSIYGFAIYDSFVYTVEFNKVFEKEQARFLKDNYQDLGFEMPL